MPGFSFSDVTARPIAHWAKDKAQMERVELKRSTDTWGPAAKCFLEKDLETRIADAAAGTIQGVATLPDIVVGLSFFLMSLIALRKVNWLNNQGDHQLMRGFRGLPRAFKYGLRIINPAWFIKTEGDDGHAETDLLIKPQGADEGDTASQGSGE